MPALPARDRKYFPAFDCGCKTVHLPRIGKLVRNDLFGGEFPPAPQFQPDRSFDIQRIVGTQNGGIPDNLQRRALVGTSRNQHRGQSSSMKIQRQDGRSFDIARL